MRSRSTGGSCARPSSGTPATRSTTRETPSSTPSQRGAGAGRGSRGAGAPSRHGWPEGQADPRPDGDPQRRAAARPAQVRRPRRAQGRPHHGRRARRTGACLRCDGSARRGRGSPRPRRATLEGHRRADLDLPARRRHLSAAQDDLEHQPASPGELLRRPATRARRNRSPPARRRSPAHAHRSRRDGQDAPRARGSGRARRPTIKAASSGSALLLFATPRSSRDDLADARCERRPRRAHR